jgi:hypothetical protein
LITDSVYKKKNLQKRFPKLIDPANQSARPQNAGGKSTYRTLVMDDACPANCGRGIEKEFLKLQEVK